MTPIYGRTHNPFSGEKEETIFPIDHPMVDKIKEELAKHSTPVEIEADETTMVVRSLRRTAHAAVKIAIDMIDSQKITAQQAIASLPMENIVDLMATTIADLQTLVCVGEGLPGAPGVVTGKLASSTTEALMLHAKSPTDKIILYVEKTTPEDMAALDIVAAVVSRTGGVTSHSAVVARQKGIPCIVSYEHKSATPFEVNAVVTVDGTNGKMYLGEAKYVYKPINANLEKLLSLCSQSNQLAVYANADTVDHLSAAIDAGAAGVGLCRTEHTFFTPEGIECIREVILSAETNSLPRINNLYQKQFSHFVDYFKKSGSLPVTVRLLDPPMHEFLPDTSESEIIKSLAKKLKIPMKDVAKRINSLKEVNPMLGHRGCRLGISFNDLYMTQARAIVAAAFSAMQGAPGKRTLGIMIPLIADINELKVILEKVNEGIQLAKNDQLSKMKERLTIQVGTMLETPRACILANGLAELTDFLSFGTNDLTQMTWGLSRDDSAKFTPAYIRQEILKKDPFVMLDRDGVGALMDHAVNSLTVENRKKVKIGICGEHGGDPDSIGFFNDLKMDYISCSPPRILLARLCAAKLAAKDVEPVEKIFETMVLTPIVQEVVIEPPKTEMPQLEGDAALNYKLNSLIGHWLSPIPSTVFSWIPDPSGQNMAIYENNLIYAKLHKDKLPLSIKTDEEHVISLGYFSDKKVWIKSEKGEINSFDFPSEAVCSIALLHNSMFLNEKAAFTKALGLKFGNAIVPVPPVAPTGASSTSVDTYKEPIPEPKIPKSESLDDLKKLSVTNFAEKLAGKFVLVKPTNTWCKVVGHLPSEEWAVHYLIVMLPKTSGLQGNAAQGPLHEFMKFVIPIDKTSMQYKTKLKNIEVGSVIDVKESIPDWA